MEQTAGKGLYGKLCLFSGSTLKIIAVIAMIIDHLAAGLLLFALNEGAAFIGADREKWVTIYYVCRNIGRTAFPIFCFLLVEGFLHTRNKQKYAINLFVFALISEIPYDLMRYHHMTMDNQNVFFTLLISLLVIWGMERCEAWFSNLGTALCMKVIFVMLGCIGAVAAKGDYTHRGVLLVAIFYFLHEYRLIAGIVGYLCMLYEPWCLPAFILVQFYNGKRGIKMKYPFYAVYPVHMLVFYLVWYLMHKG